MQWRARVRMNVARGVVGVVVMASLGCSESPTSPTSPTANPNAPAPLTRFTILYGALNCQPLRTGSIILVSAYTPESSRAYESVDDAKVTWTTSDPSVLRPSTTPGFVRLEGSGTAELRAEYQGAFAALPITVFPEAYPLLDVSVQGGVLPLAASPMGRAVTRDRFAGASTDVTAATTFSSSDTRIATVDGPRISFKPVLGNAVITGRHNGLVGACGIAVHPRQY